MLYTTFQPNILSGSGGKVDLSSIAILATAAILILDQPQCFHSESLQPYHAACEIIEPWVQ